MTVADSGTGWPRGWWFWLLGAPATVTCGLLLGRNIFLVFALYHLGFCLILPGYRNMVRRGCSLREHLMFLGIGGPGAGRGFLVGAVLGILLAVGTIVAFRWFGELFLADQNLSGALAAWGVTRTSLPIVLWFMTLVNGPAEELYWRGFVQTELSGCRPRQWAILLTAACYASYHGVTVYLLVASLPVALLFMAFILAAGVFWGWLREKTGSVWPALLSHAGAAAAYMIVARPLLDF